MRRHLVLALVVLVGCALRLWGLGQVALIGDEAYYWLWSKHLALSYLDNPAGMALLVRTSTLVGGESEIGIRWLNALLGTGAICLVYGIGARLFGQRTALVASTLLAVGAPYVIVSRFVYTDALQLFLLLLNFWLLLPFLRCALATSGNQPTWRFLAAGLSLGLLFNTKYSAYPYVVVMIGLLIWQNRALFGDPRTWMAVVVAACGLLPVLLWNASHQWASFRWQYHHFFAPTVHATTLWQRVGHAFRYLTPPIAFCAAVGAVQVRGSRRLLLVVPAASLVLPVVAGSTSSPRNWVVGTALLLLPAADVLVKWMDRRVEWVARGIVVAVSLLALLYSLGTVVETVRPSVLPSSSIAGSIRQSDLGWRESARLGLDPKAYLFAVDYQIAAQLRYYTGLDVQTGWDQYKLWEMPPVCGSEGAERDVQLIALPYLDQEVLSERIEAAFRDVRGPVRLYLGSQERNALYVWTARGCVVDQKTFLDWFDYLTLAAAGGDR